MTTATRTEADKLRQFVKDLQIKHFSGDELVQLAENVARDRTGKLVRNDYPPRNLWPALGRVLIVAEQLRVVLGCPVILTSGYRTTDYNDAVGGSPRSQHLQGRALDLRPTRGTLAEWRDAAISLRGTSLRDPSARFYRREPSTWVWRGGIGTYAAKGDRPAFLHIDVRGADADWAA